MKIIKTGAAGGLGGTYEKELTKEEEVIYLITMKEDLALRIRKIADTAWDLGSKDASTELHNIARRLENEVREVQEVSR